METFDWIVIGAGITGAALGYELAQQGCSVLLVERHEHLRGATRYSYGGIAYWAGNTDLTRQICAESLAIHANLSAELEADTQFRRMNLLLTIAPDQDIDAIVATFNQFTHQPQRLTPKSAQHIEPLLNPEAIAAALLMPHAQIEPQRTAQAYRAAMERLGGKTLIAEVINVQPGKITTTEGDFSPSQIAICAGALTRQLLQQLEINLPQYFSYAESIETDPTDVKLRTIVMPAITQRFELEAAAGQADQAELWDQPDQEMVPAILDAGALQFQDGHIRMGQISRTLSDWNAAIDPLASTALMRQQIGQILPAIAELPGSWCCCKVAFSRDHLPIVGELPGQPGVHLFSGFSNPMALVPGIARRYAIAVNGQPDKLLQGLGADRFFEA
jgi:glycine/D-amino acid oxidase-like deaminating enzyme